MRISLVLLLIVVASVRAAHGQQPPQTYTPPTYAPQTYTPQTYAPPSYSPPGYTPQTGPPSGEQTRPKQRRRMVKCMRSDDVNDYCVFYATRDFRQGSPCTCDGVGDSSN